MPDPKKQEYYRKNRETRLKYQREYYVRRKARLAREKELGLLLDPEEWTEEQKARVEYRREYHRQYYLKNRDKIRMQRAGKRAKQKRAE